ncbi:DMT family transporter [Deferribacter thermophilus]|uniref:EamA family transporter n=1 Tax=Deferribacter thermophilus TaxID=53573 RepID=UPI003C2766FB
MLGFVLVLISAFFHSVWNMLLKSSFNKYHFNFFIHITNFVLFSFIYLIFFKSYFYLKFNIFLYSLLASLFFSLYHICLSTAYRYGELSSYYPIINSSPLFVFIWAKFLLKEKVSVFGIIGIIMIILGVYIITSEVTSNEKRNFNGIVFSLLAAIFYSFGALIDKIGVSGDNIFLYIYFLTMFMTIQMWLFNRKFIKEKPLDTVKRDFIKILFGGCVLLGSIFSYRFGLSMVNLSYAIFLRQANVLFGVILGYLFLKEKITIYKLIGAFLIFIGINILRILN